MANIPEHHHDGDVIFVWIAVMAWFLGPVRCVIKGNPVLSLVDIGTHILALREYGLPFLLGLVVVFSVMYLSLPHLWVLCRHVWHRCISWTGSTKPK